jgi:cbb3-type cytochrome oxidase subunit 3
MMELIELRSAFTVVSLATFIGIIWWAWRPGSKRQERDIMADLMNDDDRVLPAGRGEQK